MLSSFCLKCLIDHTKITTAKCPVCKIDFDVDEILIDSQLSKEIEGLDYQCQQCVKTVWRNWSDFFKKFYSWCYIYLDEPNRLE